MRKNFTMKRLYYSISEVSKITDIEQYVLRYWETEFEQLKPGKNSAGNRIYTNKDIKLILYIKKLLREDKFTIEGAKKLLKEFDTSDESIDKKEKECEGSKNEYVDNKFEKPSTVATNELSLFSSDDSIDEDNFNNDKTHSTNVNLNVNKDLEKIHSELNEILNLLK